MPLLGGGGVHPGTLPLRHAATDPPLLEGCHALSTVFQQFPSMYVTTVQLGAAAHADEQSSTV